MAEAIEVEVAYALPQRQELRRLRVPAGTTAIEAVECSGIREAFPDLVIEEEALGVFGRRISPDYTVQPGDRIEIYRPLIADPKEARRRRAEQQR